MSYRSSDISTLFRDAPDTIIIGAVSGKCWLDDSDAVQGEDGPSPGTVVRVVKATVETAAVPGVGGATSVTVNGTSYAVHAALKNDDGATTDLVLVKA